MIKSEIMQREVEEVVNILCDICGTSCKSADIDRQWEYAYLSANWGYGSTMDGEAHRCHLCSSCYRKVQYFIEYELGGKILVEYYG